MKIELICVPSDLGHGANDGSYYPIGLLTIATHLKTHIPELDISVVDMHHNPTYEPKGNIVGISASSTLNYGNVLKVASIAKKNGATVVVGGPHASELPIQILTNRHQTIDFVITGKGEEVMLEFVKQYMSSKPDYEKVPNLYWFDMKDKSVHNSHKKRIIWNYDDYLPLNFDLLNPGIETYWNHFKKTINNSYDAVFIVFTHFGCGYKKRQSLKQINRKSISNYCSYCSLLNEVYAREPENITQEIFSLIDKFNIKEGAKILLKCYGDNMGPQFSLLEKLAEKISNNAKWKKYDISWTFYMQSNYMTDKMGAKLKEVGTENLFIGFDSANETVQKLNGLGTSNLTHYKCISNCIKYNINIQAALMVGCAGETINSLDDNLEFANYLSKLDNIERINTSVCIIMPGAKNYELLKNKEPWIAELDYLDTSELQKLWIKHYCDGISFDPDESLMILNDYINEIDKLSPGIHSSMGYSSNRYKALNK